MSTSAKAPGSIIISCLRYQDAVKALEWLSDAFGFEEHLVVPDEGGGIAHAQLKMGSGMIMLGSARDDDFGRLVKPPESASAATTQSCYVIVDDVDAHCARAQAAGAEIVMEPADQDYGGRLYVCRDRECLGVRQLRSVGGRERLKTRPRP